MSKTIQLKKAVEYSRTRININDVKLIDFITTDNLLSNKLGLTQAVNLPPQKGNISAFTFDNILVSNIRPYLKKIWFADKKGGCSADILVFKVKKGFYPKFIYYAMFRDDFFKHMMRGSKGTKMPRGDKIHILDFTLPKIEPSIQKKIAIVLSSLDTKIEINNRINSELEAMAKTLYDYWFVQFNFPDKNGNPYKSSGGKMIYDEKLKREIPKTWKVGKTSDLFHFNPSCSIEKGKVSSYIDMNAIPERGFMTKKVKQKAFTSGVKFQNGDVVFARITPCLENGKTGLITLLEKDDIGFGSTEFIVLRGKNHALSCFAPFLARSELFRKYAIANMTGTSGRKRVDAKMLEIFPIAIPDIHLLEKFEQIVASFFDKEISNTVENQQLTKLRDWLLPMLMNGQVSMK